MKISDEARPVIWTVINGELKELGKEDHDDDLIMAIALVIILAVASLTAIVLVMGLTNALR